MNDSNTPYWLFYLYWPLCALLAFYGYKVDSGFTVSIACILAAFKLGVVLAFDSLQFVYKKMGDYEVETTYDLIWRVIFLRKRFTE